MDFGSYLRQLRKGRRLTQGQLAAAVGIDYTYVSKVENGRVDPPSEVTIRRIAAVLAVDAEELLANAGKVSAELKDAAASEPQLALLLRTIGKKPLTADQYRRMREIVEEPSSG